MPIPFALRKATLGAAALSLTALTSLSAFAGKAMPSQEEMWDMIQQQQQEIKSLKKQLNKTDEKVEATGQMVESVSAGGGGSAPGWWQKTSVGGYGEMHYNAMKDNDDDEIDFHRFVLFINHEFNEDIRLFTELELEHSLAGEGKNGEVELEQAFVEFDLNDYHQARAGLFLVPVGILNEVHEPPTFFGVERNPVEKNILPTTWWEGGAGVNGELGNGFSYDLAVHSGLNTPTTGSNAFRIRSGRQKLSEADADAGAITGRLAWSGMPGVKLAATTQYQQDVTQGNFSEDVEATLFEAHADVLKNGWGLRALYARWDLDGSAPAALGRDEQYGWYVEPSYRFDTEVGTVGFFARYNEYDNSAGLSTDTKYEQTDVGVNFWPHPDVVLKADMAFVDEPGNVEDEILNLGVGFQF